MYTQLWAMHLAFLTIGASVRALHRGKGVWLAGLLLGVLLLTHLLYTYMTVFTIVIIAAWGIHRSNWAQRFVRLGVIGASAAVISAYMWLPLLTNTAFLNASPYLQSWKYDSLGAESILGWLFTGDLFDHDRLPVLTVLFAAGVAAALLSRIRTGRMFVALFLFWLLLWFGRPTWGSLMDVLPLDDGLLLHRFAGLVTLTAIVLMGIGGAVVWRAIAGSGQPGRVVVATAVVILLLVPVLGERWRYYDNNTFWMRQSAARLAEDSDVQAILARAQGAPDGAHLRGPAGDLRQRPQFRDLSLANVLTTDGYETLAPPSESLSLNSDLIWHLDDQDMAEYALWGVRYVVAPATRTLASGLIPIMTTDRWVLYEVPGASYGTFGELVDRRTVATQADLFQLNRAWQASGEPEQDRFVRYDYPARVAVAEGQTAPGCPTGTIPFESFQPGLIQFVVDCPVDSTFIVKTSYHPNWQITIDGNAVDDFMVAPSYIGVSVPAGRHALTATYVAAPIKQPLAIAGIGMVILLLLLRWRIDRMAERVASAIARRVRIPTLRRSRTAVDPVG